MTVIVAIKYRKTGDVYIGSDSAITAGKNIEKTKNPKICSKPFNIVDTDGNVSLNGSKSFSTCSKSLAEDFSYLANSLGIRVTSNIHNREDEGRTEKRWPNNLHVRKKVSQQIKR